MKKIILLILIFLLAVSMIEAAFEKGTKSVGGSITLSSYRGDAEGDTTFYGFGVSPLVSYFVLPNLCLDVSPGLDFSRGKGVYTYNSLTIGVGARYFIKYFYGGLHFFYGYSLNKSHETDNESNFKSKQLALSVGYLFPIAGNIYLDFGLSYLKGLGNSTAHGTYRIDGETFTIDTVADNETKQLKTAFGIKIFFR